MRLNPWLIFVIALTVLLSYPATRTFAVGKPPESRADFAAYKGESFSVIIRGKSGKAWSKSVSLKIIDISEPRSKEGVTEQFSVRFQGPADYPLEKAVYTFEQPKTGRFSLFLEPADADAKGRYYQATFNLLK